MFSRLAVGEVSPLLLVSLRWLGVVILLSLFCRRSLLRDWDRLRPHLVFLSIIGMIGFTGFNSLYYLAAHSTSGVNLGIIQGSIPVYILLGAFLVFRTPVSGLQAAGVFVTIIGVLWVTAEGRPQDFSLSQMNRGDALLLFACLLYAGYTVALRNRPQVSAMGLFFVLAMAAFVASVPIATAEYILGYALWPTQTGWAVVAAITLLPSFTAQILFIKGVELIGPGRAGVFVNLVPVFGSIFAVTFLGESFQLYHATALVLVLGGIALAERGNKPSNEAAGAKADS